MRRRRPRRNGGRTARRGRCRRCRWRRSPSRRRRRRAPGGPASTTPATMTRPASAATAIVAGRRRARSGSACAAAGRSGSGGDTAELGDGEQHGRGHRRRRSSGSMQTQRVGDRGDADDHRDHGAHHDADACLAAGARRRRTPAARAAMAAGASESQASITASPNTASRATPHHIGRTMTPHDAWATAPPSVSSSSRRTMNPPTTSTAPSTAGRPHQRASHGAPPPATGIGTGRSRRRSRSAASTGSSHARTPTARAMAIVVSSERLVADRRQRHRHVRRHGARSGATTASAPVTTAPASARRRAIESDVAFGEHPMGRLDGGARRPGQQVAAGDPGRDRFDERADRHEVRVLARRAGRRSAVPSSAATSSSRRISSTWSANVGPSRRSSVEVAGEQTEGGEDRAEDDQDPRRDGHPSVSGRHVAL